MSSINVDLMFDMAEKAELYDEMVSLGLDPKQLIEQAKLTQQIQQLGGFDTIMADLQRQITELDEFDLDEDLEVDSDEGVDRRPTEHSDEGFL